MPYSKGDVVLMVSIFFGAACAVIAASDIAPPQVRLGAAALSAGFMALNALLKPPGQSGPAAPGVERPRPDGKG
jgi:hypothetical protein